MGIDCYMPLSDWRDGEDHLDAAGAETAYALDYLEGNVAGGEGFDWFYASDADRRAQVRTPITDGAYGEPWVWRYKDIRAFWSQQHFDRPGGGRSATPTEWVPGSKPIWLTELGCGAVDKGANQPNIFGDDKSAEGGRPYFSSGMPDGLMQRQFLRAHQRFWRDPANNPAGMVDTDRIYLWTWDARPFPSFPALEEVWSDGPNHRTGHWLTGRLGGAASDELIGAIAADHGIAVEAAPAAPLIGGVLVGGPGTAREAIEPVLEITGQKLLARDGALVGVVRGDVVPLEHDLLAEVDAPVLTRRRGDLAEKAGRLGLGYLDRERDYLTATATALRPGDGPLQSQSLPMVLDGAGARLAAERLLDAKAVAGDRVELALPRGDIALEPGDRIALPELEEGPFEITEIRDGAVRRVSATAVARGDAVATGVDRPRGGAGVPVPAVVPVVVAAHLPPLPNNPGRTRLVLGAFARPWPSPVRVTDDITGATLTSLGRPAAIGTVVAGIAAGPEAVWDMGSVLEIELRSGHLADVTEAAALAGSNQLAVETDGGGWEVIGFAEAELVGAGRYRLTRLLRGLDGSQTGTVSLGRRVMVLGTGTVVLPVEAHRIGERRMLRVFAKASDMSGRVQVVDLDPAPALPLAPVHLSAERQGDGSVLLRWMRRSRADGDGWGVAEPVLEHAPESWRVRIFDGATPVRTITSSVAEASYGASDQTADFGALAESFDFEVAQVSPVLGAGHEAMGTFNG